MRGPVRGGTRGRLFNGFVRRLRMFSPQTVYVRLSRNKIRLRNIESGAEVEVTPSSPFTGERLLIGDFEVAQRTLQDGLRQVAGSRWFRPAPRILMHQLEMTEGGLAEIEVRILRELAIGAGAMRVQVWTGPHLADEQVTERFHAK